MQMAKVSAALARYDAAGGLFISVLTNPTMGGVAASFASLGDIIFADFSQYLMIDKGIDSVGSMHVQFLTDQMVFRFVYRVDGEPMWRLPVTPYKGTQAQSPFITLQTRS